MNPGTSTEYSPQRANLALRGSGTCKGYAVRRNGFPEARTGRDLVPGDAGRAGSRAEKKHPEGCSKPKAKEPAAAGGKSGSQQTSTPPAPLLGARSDTGCGPGLSGRVPLAGR